MKKGYERIMKKILTWIQMRMDPRLLHQLFRALFTQRRGLLGELIKIFFSDFDMQY